LFAHKGWYESLKDTKVSYDTTGAPEKFQRYEVSGKFPTDSGKINLFSVLHQKSGYPALPVYTEPYESPVSRPDLAEEYPLVLSTGKRQAGWFHSEFRQIPWIRETQPVPEVFINPDTAAKYGVTHGDWVWVESPPEGGRAPHNKVMGQVSFRLISRPGVLTYSQHGWWRPERSATEDLHGALEWNCEALLETDNVAPETGTAGLRSQLCKVYKCTDEDIAKYRPMITREELEGLMPVAEEEM
jgi:anaerobic selenocysteine-containing dehydrogenase